MYCWTILVLFLTSTFTCYMQPYQVHLNSGATRILPPGKIQPSRSHSSNQTTSFEFPTKGTGNNVLKTNSHLPELAAHGMTHSFTSEPGIPPLKLTKVYVPFDYKYTQETEEFIRRTTEEFYSYLNDKIQRKMFSMLSKCPQKKRKGNHFKL